MTADDRPFAPNSTFRVRSGYMNPGRGLSRSPWPSAALLAPGSPARRDRGRTAGTGTVVPLRSAPLRPVSDKRRAENRERSAMADRRWPDRRDGTVMCGCGRPDCNRRADDLHEILTRGRGGSITDEANTVPLARECHDEITRGPDWAYRAGLLKHDGLCCEGRDVCERYANGDEAA